MSSVHYGSPVRIEQLHASETAVADVIVEVRLGRSHWGQVALAAITTDDTTDGDEG
jgi:hypothetical protein